MLELYHHSTSVCAAKVRLVLNEKKLDWKGIFVDIWKGDQFSPEYLKLSAAVLGARALLDGIGSFGSCYRFGGPYALTA